MKKLVLFAIMIALISGCSTNKPEAPRDRESIKIKTAVVQTVKNDYTLNYSGSVEASQVIPLNFRTAGTVDKIYAEVGDVVRKGQLLATIDDSDLKNVYNTMLAKYQQAEDAYNRLKLVHDEGSLPDIKWAEMKSNFDQAKASLDLAQSNLDKCSLYSPIDGIVGRRNIEPGQSSISLTLAPIELVKIETVFVKISVPENEINRMSDGQKATIRVSALDDKTYEGEVTNISPVAEIMSRTYTMKISVPNKDYELKPGMVCDVSLDFEGGTQILVVPNKAVSKDDSGNTYVFVVSPDKKKVKKQIISVGRHQGSGIEVTGGLTEGQVVVCEGGEKLSDNSLITL